MALYRIVFSANDGTHFEQIVSDVPQLIGRSTKSDITLAEDSVSRRHAKLYVVNERLHIEDLASSNGVLVNGTRVTKAQLSESDIVQIGCYTLRAALLSPKASQKLARRTEIEYSEVAPIHKELIESDQSSLSFLYQISQCLYSQRQLKPFVESVLDAIMENIPAERGFILARSDTKDSLKLITSHVRQRSDSDPPVSHTLIDHVVSTKSSVLTTDASQDDRFESSDSIAYFQIKAVICAPLSGHDGVYGVIYVDSKSSPVSLTQRHLQLLSIVGQIVGAGIENILLNEKQIRQERLAGIGETVAGTSHDMRNILMGLSGGTEMIELACARENWERVQDGVRILRLTLSRFKNLSENLLTYARAAKLKLKETDPDAIINDVLGTVEAEAKKRSIALRFAPHAPANVIMMDSEQMYRVLLNLVRNAMDAMEGREGTIDIESGNDDGAAFIRVKDTGRGIPPEYLDKIGQPFFTTKEDAGTGLGLAISYRIMEQHHGKIQVDSVPDQGTTFTLKFPPDHSKTRHDIRTPLPGF